MRVEELSGAERQVLKALGKLKGTGTPWQVIENSVPTEIEPMVRAIRDEVRKVLSAGSQQSDDRRVNELVRSLAALAAEPKEDYRVEVARLVSSEGIPTWIDIEVPLQRKAFAEMLGDTVPKVSAEVLKLSKSGAGKRASSVLMSQVDVMNASSWLQSKGLVILSESLEKYYSLASKKAGEQDLPERRAIKALKKERGRIRMPELGKAAHLSEKEVPIAVGWLKRKGWASIQKSGAETIIELTEDGKLALERKGKDEETILRLAEGEIHQRDIDEFTLKQLSSRQDLLKVREEVMRWVSLTPDGDKALAAGIEDVEEVSQMTPELLRSGGWRGLRVRPYDLGTFAPVGENGKRHPMARLVGEVRRIFLDMGFTEVDMDYVQGCFWDMDALFIPQDHPARDMQDTFFLSNPSEVPLPDRKIVEVIRSVHEKGIAGSRGWGGKWDEEMARKAILRTHTTVNSIRYLAEHPDPPVRTFTVSRVFRREATDARHLSEFTQVEGVVMEKGASLGMLKGMLAEFLERLGCKEWRVRPSYYPYTEPSMDCEVNFAGRWMELGGSGIFRPEVTAPFGIKHPVIAWGFGLERLAMVTYGVDDMRKLYMSDIDWLKAAPLVRGKNGGKAAPKRSNNV
ncbi:MAG: phenylalanine--tRNA ligase subunit alpha [Methanobacteriota archaeon]